MKPFFAAVTMAASLGTLAQAQPLDSKQVPADAKWLVHLDLNAAKAGQVTQTVSSIWLRVPSVAQNVQKIIWATGLDPRRDIHSVLIYGRSYEKDGAVGIVQANVARTRLVKFLRQQTDYHTKRHGSLDVMGWTDTNGQPGERAMFACLFRPDVVVFGRNVDGVKHALDVLDGESPSLRSEHPLFAPMAPAGTIVEFRGVGFSDAGLPFASPLVRKSECLFALGGEEDNETFVTVRMISDSEKTARQLRAVAEGLVAMARLRFDQNAELLPHLDSVKVSQDATTVTVQCRWPADELSVLLKRLWKKQQSRT